MNRDLLLDAVNNLPEPLVGQVLDYVEFVRDRHAPTDVTAEDRFWRNIALIDWDAESPTAAVSPLLASLTACTIEEIYSYQDQLAIHLSKLDGPEYFNSFAAGPMGASADSFLYGRCFVVAKGKSFYQQVLENPSTFPPGVDFESLLYLEDEAYETKMGEELTRSPAVIFETAFNKENWGEKAISFS